MFEKLMRLPRPAVLPAVMLAVWAASAAAQTPVASTRQLTVDLSNEYRPATHVASGSLYGLSDTGPDLALLAPTRPIMFTQMAPKGTQVPVGDALKVARLAAAAGAKITVRFPDIYPNFPYKWIGWDDWNAKVDDIVATVTASGARNIYAYELWNEPNWTWDTAAAGSFMDGWSRTHARVRRRDKTTPIMGPSIDRYDPAFMKAFLIAAKAAGTLPEILSWHELGFPEGTYQDIPNTPHIASHIAAYRALEASLGIAPLPISINEFAVTTEEGVPGSMVRYFAQFERGGVESANVAFWFTPGKLSNIVTEEGQANGGWWLFKWYGDLTGKMAMTLPTAANEVSFDGIASVDANRRRATVLFGGSDGDNLVVLKGFPTTFQHSAHIRVEKTPWYGPDVAIGAPDVMFEGDFTITDDSISVPMTDMDKAAGYRMVVTAAGRDRSRYEVETLLPPGAAAARIVTASNGAYVGGFGRDAPPLTLTVAAPVAGRYRMDVRYANAGESAVSQAVTVNGVAGTMLAYPRTGGALPSEKTGVAGTVVTLRKGANRIALAPGTGTLDLDYVQLAPAAATPLRLEAERAANGSSMVEPSSYASGQYFVAPNNAVDSHVTFTADVPTAGSYMMDIGYSNIARTIGEQELTVNDVAMGKVRYGSTGARFRSVPTKGPRRVKSIPVALRSGRNAIRLAYGGVGFVELDYIELRHGVTRYEAEGATFGGFTAKDDGAASGGRYAARAPGMAGTARFQVNVADAGQYMLRLAYANAAATPATSELAINGVRQSVALLPSGGSAADLAPRLKEIPVTLRRGTNTIALSTAAEMSVDLDYLDVVPAG